MNPIVINVSCGGRYPPMAKRLKKHLRRIKYNGDTKIWINEYPPDCPSHDTINYAFKSWAFKWALDQGYEEILWMDSAIMPQKPLDAIFEHMGTRGYLLLQNGWDVLTWTSEACLRAMEVTDEEAKNMTLLMANMMGLNFSHEITREFFLKYWFWCQEPDVMNGSWINDDKPGSNHGICSSNPATKGHRHDQSVASILMNQMGMTFTPPKGWLEYWNDPNLTGESIVITKGAM